MTNLSTDIGAQLRALITSGLEQPYTSHSGFDGTATGNHYQSIALGSEATAGFRGDRSAVLDCIDFRGRKVLDLGSNLGEMSRSARSRGARIVDGVEYDPFFVELSQLITAYNGQTRVSFRQGDITDPALYGERYDIVMALSVFHYVSRVLDQLASITDVLLIETHKLHGNFDGGYLLPVQERFPAMRVLGQTDWGQLGDGSEARLVVLFAKDRELLENALSAPHAWDQPPSAPAPARHRRLVDPASSQTHRAFFEAWDYETADELLAAVDAIDVPVEALATNKNLARHGYSGWGYWLLYLKGWLTYRQTGIVGPGNPYFDYMTTHYVPDGADAAIARTLRDPAVAAQLIARRFADLDRIAAAVSGDIADEIAPIRATVGPIPPQNPLRLVDATSGETIPARRMDGWHRMFGARALGAPELRAEIVEESRFLRPLHGTVETFAIEDGVVSVSGWCFHPTSPLDAIELRCGGNTIAIAIPEERVDVAAAHTDVSHAGASGFHLEGRLLGAIDEPKRFELLGMRDWLPVGHLRIDYEPAMEHAPTPPGELLRKVYGYDNVTPLRTRTALAGHALLDALSHYRLLDGFREVLLWDAGCGLLAPLVSRRLPSASFTALVEDPHARAWLAETATVRVEAMDQEPPTALKDATVDLVLRDRPLAVLGDEQLAAWLQELRRILRPGGYAVCITGWPEPERSATIQRCSAYLDVVGAVTTSWAGGHVVVLRRP